MWIWLSFAQTLTLKGVTVFFARFLYMTQKYILVQIINNTEHISFMFLVNLLLFYIFPTYYELLSLYGQFVLVEPLVDFQSSFNLFDFI